MIAVMARRGAYLEASSVAPSCIDKSASPTSKELYVSASLLSWPHPEFIPVNGAEDWVLGSMVFMTMAVDWKLFVRCQVVGLVRACDASGSQNTFLGSKESARRARLRLVCIYIKGSLRWRQFRRGGGKSVAGGANGTHPSCLLKLWSSLGKCVLDRLCTNIPVSWLKESDQMRRSGF